MSLNPDNLAYLVKELQGFGNWQVGFTGHLGCYTEKIVTINFTEKIRYSQKFCIR